MQDLAELNTRFAIDGQLRFRLAAEGYPVAEVSNDFATATVALQGAHLLTWQPRGEQPVIWLSEAAQLLPGKSVRGGVPICWPWFGPSPVAGQPAHGYARTVPWQLIESLRLGDGATRLVFELKESEATRALWPHLTVVRLALTVGARLEIELMTRNDGSTPVMLGEALHTYFAVSDLAGTEIVGLEGTEYVDKVAGGERRRQAGPITVTGEVDRVYLGTDAECVIVDRGLKRRIRIGKSDSRSTVVWNPWQEKAEKMGDLGPDGWRRMVCVESGNALDDLVELPPGGEHTLAVVYAVEPLK